MSDQDRKAASADEVSMHGDGELSEENIVVNATDHDHGNGSAHNITTTESDSHEANGNMPQLESADNQELFEPTAAAKDKAAELPETDGNDTETSTDIAESLVVFANAFEARLVGFDFQTAGHIEPMLVQEVRRILDACSDVSKKSPIRPAQILVSSALRGLIPGKSPNFEDQAVHRLVDELSDVLSDIDAWVYLKGGPTPAWINLHQDKVMKMGDAEIKAFHEKLYKEGKTVAVETEIEDIRRSTEEMNQTVQTVRQEYNDALKVQEERDAAKEELKEKIDSVKAEVEKVRTRKDEIKQTLVKRNKLARENKEKGILTPIEQKLKDYQDTVQRLSDARQRHSELLSQRKTDRANFFITSSENVVRKEEQVAQLESIQESNLILERKIKEASIESKKLEQNMELLRPFKEKSIQLREKCRALEAEISREKEEIRKYDRERDNCNNSISKLSGKLEAFQFGTYVDRDLAEAKRLYDDYKRHAVLLSSEVAKEDAKIKRLQRLVDVEEARDAEARKKFMRSMHLIEQMQNQ